MSNPSGSKTPKPSKNAASTSGYSPVKLPTSPSACNNITGMKRIARDLAADIYNHIQKWNVLHLKGCDLVKTISNLKTEDPLCKSAGFEIACTELSATACALEKRKKDIVEAATQLCTIDRLFKEVSKCPDPEPLFISLDVSSMVRLIKPIAAAYQAEYNDKKFIADHIPFTKTTNEAIFLCILWTYQSYISKEINLNLEALLTEVGHRTF